MFPNSASKFTSKGTSNSVAGDTLSILSWFIVCGSVGELSKSAASPPVTPANSSVCCNSSGGKLEAPDNIISSSTFSFNVSLGEFTSSFTCSLNISCP